MPDERPNNLENLDAEDAKLVTLARGARSRIAAPEGAALRDETGRTYASATVALPSLRLSAVQAAVAQAVAAGARSIEAIAVVGPTTLTQVDPEGQSALRDLGGDSVRVILVQS